jgi:hypothetical protein
MKYQPIEDFDSDAGATKKAGAATCLVSLGRFDLPKQMRRDRSGR